MKCTWQLADASIRSMLRRVDDYTTIEALREGGAEKKTRKRERGNGRKKKRTQHKNRMGCVEVFAFSRVVKCEQLVKNKKRRKRKTIEKAICKGEIKSKVIKLFSNIFENST